MDHVERPPARSPPRPPLQITKNTRFVSVTQLAERYSVSPDTVWRWTRKGLLPKPVKINPQVVRWDLDLVEARDAERKRA